MEELIKWIIDNKELVLLVFISVSIPISIHFGKTVINNTNIKKNTTNHNKYISKENRKKRSSKNGNFQSNKIYQNKIELNKIKLYSTGKRGKVYTTHFHKLMNHNFGIEITLKNPLSTIQNVKVGWCIYKDGKEIIKGTFNEKVAANGSLTKDFYVPEQTFNKLKTGKYKSQFWINDKRVQKVYFIISNK